MMESESAKIISRFNGLSKEHKLQLVSYFIDELKSLHEITEQEILGKKEVAIPIGIFGNDALSSLEAIVKYLKEAQKLRLAKIARLLNRSSKTIWATYHNAARKMPSTFGSISNEIFIPVSVFAGRKFSTLESLVGFIKDLGYSNHEVALMLRLDDRTIWTVYDRVKMKRGMKH
ncbi:hypothetical protein HYT53_03870 [Candidatus Woesearchaeota archaeon]|nr:hypothetical protein [Candidatus Woesearchaeota archaeon]